VDKVVSIRLVTSFVHHLLNLLVTLVLNVKSIEDVLLDCSREKDRLLLDERDLLVVPPWLQFSDVLAIKKDSAICWLVESLNHRYD